MMLPKFRLESFFKKWEFNTPYILCSSDSQTLTLQELLSMADQETLEQWENLTLGYTQVPGLPNLKSEIARLYTRVPLEGIGTFAGAEEAIATVMHVLVKKGDHVIVPTPCYQSLSAFPEYLEADLSPLPIKEGKKGWFFDIEELYRLIRPNTRLIVTNFPHNPTAVHIDRSTLEQIIACARSSNAYLFSDEAYRFSELNGQPPLPPAADLYEKALSLGVLSKTFGLAGLRMGWLATQDTELLEKCLDFKCYFSLCNSAVSELLGVVALRAKDHILKRNLAIMHRNLDLLDAFFAAHKGLFDWKRPSAGSTAFVRLLSPRPVESFIEDLIHKEGVLLLPGSVYDYPGNYFRIGFGRSNLPEALERLDNYVRSYENIY